MKKALTAMVVFFSMLCCAATSQAYYYDCEITGGSVQLSVNADASELSFTTTEDLLVGLTYDAPSESMPLSYTLSTDLQMNLSGFISYDLVVDDLPLGIFPSFDPADYIGDGTSSMSHTGETLISADFGKYHLEDATLTYDVLFTPVSGTSNAYAISIDTLTLSGGNTQDFLSSIVSDINAEMPSSASLRLPLSVDIEATGSIEIDASPVPVPAAIWFLGSGLIGMLGLRKKRIKP